MHLVECIVTCIIIGRSNGYKKVVFDQVSVNLQYYYVKLSKIPFTSLVVVQKMFYFSEIAEVSCQTDKEIYFQRAERLEYYFDQSNLNLKTMCSKYPRSNLRYRTFVCRSLRTIFCESSLYTCKLGEQLFMTCTWTYSI